MAKRNQIREQASRNPSVVLRAFAPETDFVLTLDGALLLERLECKYITGGKPGLRDLILSILVMTDEDAVLEALRKRTLDKLMSSASAGKTPGDILQLGDKVAQALATAMEPTDSGTPSEKKSSAERDGGSPSST
jgi:hypothetical protein